MNDRSIAYRLIGQIHTEGDNALCDFTYYIRGGWLTFESPQNLKIPYLQGAEIAGRDPMEIDGRKYGAVRNVQKLFGALQRIFETEEQPYAKENLVLLEVPYNVEGNEGLLKLLFQRSELPAELLKNIDLREGLIFDAEPVTGNYDLSLLPFFWRP